MDTNARIGISIASIIFNGIAYRATHVEPKKEDIISILVLLSRLVPIQILSISIIAMTKSDTQHG